MPQGKIVAVSGFFDVLHRGHISLLRGAKELAGTNGKLVVILGTDHLLIRKKGYFFMPHEEKVEILKSVKYVDEVVVSIDDDLTVRNTLLKVKADIFANGADRTADTIPEYDFCIENGIEMVFGVGGEDKIQSDTFLIEEGTERYRKVREEILV